MKRILIAMLFAVLGASCAHTPVMLAGVNYQLPEAQEGEEVLQEGEAIQAAVTLTEATVTPATLALEWDGSMPAIAATRVMVRQNHVVLAWAGPVSAPADIPIGGIENPAAPVIAVTPVTEGEQWSDGTTKTKPTGLLISATFQSPRAAKDAARAFLHGNSSPILWVMGTDSDNDRVPNRVDACRTVAGATATGCPSIAESADMNLPPTSSEEGPAAGFPSSFPPATEFPILAKVRVVKSGPGVSGCEPSPGRDSCLVVDSLGDKEGGFTISGLGAKPFAKWENDRTKTGRRVIVTLFAGTLAKFDNGGTLTEDFDGAHLYQAKFRVTTGTGRNAQTNLVDQVVLANADGTFWQGEVEFHLLPTGTVPSRGDPEDDLYESADPPLPPQPTDETEGPDPTDTGGDIGPGMEPDPNAAGA